MNHQKTLVLGIGNTLLTDEGAGIHALNLFQSEYSRLPGITCLDGGTLSFTLAGWIEDCHNLIVFDAAELQQPAGTVMAYVDSEMDGFLGTCKRSVHEVGLLDLLDIARLTGHLPQRRALIGIQPQTMGWGMQASASVRAALPQAVDTALELFNKWQKLNIDQESLVI